MLTQRESPACTTDFIKTGYTTTSIFGFTDCRATFGPEAVEIIDQWISQHKAMNGQITKIFEEPMLAVAKAGGSSLFGLLKSKSSIDRPFGFNLLKNEIVHALFSNETMINHLIDFLDQFTKYKNNFNNTHKKTKKINQEQQKNIEY